MSVVIVLIILVLLYIYGKSEKTLCSNNDGQCYKISTAFDDKTEAMNELSRINQFNAKFIKYLRNKYLWSPNSNQEMRKITQNLINNYNPDVLKENNPTSTTNTSYVLAKGKSIAFCLREKETGRHQIEDSKMIDFVNIHEISHLAMSFHDPSHGTEFWKTFKLLLNEANIAGLYDPINWNNSPKNYCGLLVDYNPLFDEQL